MIVDLASWVLRLASKGNVLQDILGETLYHPVLISSFKTALFWQQLASPNTCSIA